MVDTFEEWLRDPEGAGVTYHYRLPDGLWVGIKPLLFHWTLMVGQIGDRVGFEDRWCYENQKRARDGLDEWARRGGVGEPTGWHRHPRTGRRRLDGDPVREYIEW